MDTESNTDKIVLKWLEQASLKARFEQSAARLSVRIDGGDEIEDVRVAVAFPVTTPGQNIELTGADGKALGMLRSLAGLEEESRLAIEAALQAKYLIPRIRRVLEMAEATPSIMRWKVLTDRGERAFSTESSRESLKRQEPDRLRITDLAGNQYEIPAVAELDATSRALLGNIL